VEVDLSKELDFGGILDDLNLESMKTTYPEYVDTVGSHNADNVMLGFYGDNWIKHRETIWQWYDERGVE